MERLTCSVMTYAWGKVGSDSQVAQLAQNNNKNLEIDQQEPYAELWMGAHANGPSVVNSSQLSLNEWIEKHPECLGNSKIREKFGSRLPYLLKVLSVNKALSIQAHPDKLLAEKLHAARPDIYKDSNHKPELALALTPFEALCGFRPIDQIRKSISAVPELRTLIGAESADRFVELSEDGAATDDCRQALKECYTSLMKVDQGRVGQQLKRLLQRLQQSGVLNSGVTDSEAMLIQRLNTNFPGDRGSFSVFFFNYFLLQPGEALFLGPNEPHAYLSGDCIECMASSDNVVRAGLTPKYIDVDTLVEMLTYRTGQTELLKPTGSESDPYIQHYTPPVEEFTVAKIEVPGSINADYSLSSECSVSILLVASGRGVATCNSSSDNSRTLSTEPLYPGTVLLLSADSHVTLRPTPPDTLLMFRAHCNFH